jgi:hypothetical protein
MAAPSTPLEQRSTYRYQPLESQRRFRLLRLHRGQGDRIDCSLHHYTVGSETCPSYRAMSYTWGKDSARFKVHLPGGSYLKVRENLRNALRAVRDKQTDCWLWIDAICINQDSNPERNDQVKLMADIYCNANVVIVWLQSAGENADVSRAFKFIHAAATYKNDYRHSVARYSKAHPHDHSRNWRSVQSLCKLRYWKRKWIIQELVLARTAVLQVGNSTCSMNDLQTFCRQLPRHNNNSQIAESDKRVQDFVARSPAASLALQREETTAAHQPRHL